MSRPEDARARVIAIDGPAASGKSVVGTGVASALGYRFFDTGAMYRAVTWACLQRAIEPTDEERVSDMVERARIDVAEAPRGSSEPTRVLVDGADATPHLRDSNVEMTVSIVSRIARVRAVLVRLQRALAADGRVVMAGRDIGTVVLPDAPLKVYLDASPGVRAGRRAAQAADAGIAVDAEMLERRDAIDSTRQDSPLTAAHDAVIINTDDMPVQDVIDRIVELAR